MKYDVLIIIMVLYNSNEMSVIYRTDETIVLISILIKLKYKFLLHKSKKVIFSKIIINYKIQHI